MCGWGERCVLFEGGEEGKGGDSLGEKDMEGNTAAMIRERELNADLVACSVQGN